MTQIGKKREAAVAREQDHQGRMILPKIDSPRHFRIRSVKSKAEQMHKSFLCSYLNPERNPERERNDELLISRGFTTTRHLVAYENG